MRVFPENDHPFSPKGGIVIKSVVKLLLIGVCIFLGIVLMSNVDKGVTRYQPDVLQVKLRPTSDLTLQKALAAHPELSVSDEAQGLVHVPFGQVEKYQRVLRVDRHFMMVNPIPVPPSYSVKKYLFEVKEQLKHYQTGELGTLTYTSRIDRDYSINVYVKDLILRSLSYLIPGLLLGILAGYALALWAVLKPRAGMVLDNLHALMLAIPDFFLITLLQLTAILIAKVAGKKVFLVMQFASEVPLLIPLLSITLLPAALVYGSMRIAVGREWDEGYIKTAYAKGLSRMMVIFRHILRNTSADLLAILPRTMTVGLTSLVVAEVMCGIFGLGGYAINNNLYKVTSLPATCAILALFAILFHMLIALLQKRLVVSTKEGEA